MAGANPIAVERNRRRRGREATDKLFQVPFEETTARFEQEKKELNQLRYRDQAASAVAGDPAAQERIRAARTEAEDRFRSRQTGSNRRRNLNGNNIQAQLEAGKRAAKRAEEEEIQRRIDELANEERNSRGASTSSAATPPPPPKKLSDFLDDDQTKPFEGFDASNYEDRPGGLQETKSAGTFSIQEFRTNITSVSDNILPTHSFLVTFPRMNWINSTLKKMDIERYLTMRCETVIAPVMSFLQENIVRRYGYGPLENVPYGVNSQEFTLQFIVDRNSLIPEFFEQWMNFIINRDSFGGANMLNTQNGRDPYEVQYKDNYVAPMINIQVYDRRQINVMSYKIYDVFPNNIQSINLNWSDVDQLMRLNVSFSFTDFRLITQYKVAEGPPKEKVTLNDGPITIPQETLEQVELPQIGTLYISGDDEQAPGSQDATASSSPEDTPPVSPTPYVSIRNFNGGAAA